MAVGHVHCASFAYCVQCTVSQEWYEYYEEFENIHYNKFATLNTGSGNYKPATNSVVF